jgi:hypothetical protein
VKLNLSRNVAALVLLVLAAMISTVVLLALGKSTPDFLSVVVLTGIGALAGVAMPSSVSDTIDQLHTTALTSSSRTAPTPAPLPAPAPVTDPPAAP